MEEVYKTSYINLLASDQLEPSRIATSDCSKYIPMYAIKNNTVIHFDSEEKESYKVLEFQMPSINRVRHLNRRNIDFLRALKNTDYLCKFTFKVAGEEHFIFLYRGVIYNQEKEFLMCLCIDSEFVAENTIPDIDSNEDFSKYLLLISEKFKDPKYKNILKYLEKTYIAEIKELKIDVLETVRIESWMFQNNFEIPKFNNINDLKKHLQEEIPKEILQIYK